MLSNQHNFQQDPLTEIGGSLILSGVAALMIITSSMSRTKFESLEDDLLNIYHDDFLTMKLNFKEDISKLFLNSFTVSGRFKNKFLHDGELSLIVNKEAVNAFSQRFKQYPMFKILNSNKTYKVSHDQFIKDHQGLYALFGNKTFEAIMNSTKLKPEVTENAKWMFYALRPFLDSLFGMGDKVDTIEFIAKPVKSVTIY